MKPLFSNCYLLLILGAFTALAGCHQDFPDDVEGDAELWFLADMPQRMLLEAGKANYEMKTAIEMGDLGVEEHSATFRQVGCENCPGQLKIIFRDYKIKEEIEAFQADSTFGLGQWVYRGQDFQANSQAAVTDPLSFRFSGKSDGTPPFSYEWQFGDGYISTAATPIHTYGTSGDFEIKLKILDATGCSDQSYHKLSVGNNYFACPYDFKVEHLGNETLRFTTIRLDGKSIDEASGFFWDLGFGAGATLFSDKPTIEFQYQFAGIFPVTLLVLDSCGCPCPVTKNVYTATSPSCVSEIAFKTIPEDKETSRVTIEWTDERGAFYTSYGPNGQPLTSDFQLLEREAYKNNPLGQETYKLSASFACTLYNPANPNDSMIVKNGQSIFALEIPE
jgi:PKD repeat protein